MFVITDKVCSSPVWHSCCFTICPQKRAVPAPKKALCLHMGKNSKKNSSTTAVPFQRAMFSCYSSSFQALKYINNRGREGAQLSDSGFMLFQIIPLISTYILPGGVS